MQKALTSFRNKKMKAAFVKKTNKIEIRETYKPVPENGDILIKIDACGLCGSDFIEAKRWAGKWKRFGHEIVGSVAETGEGVTGFTIGDQVVVALSIACGSCASCRENSPRTCQNLITTEQGGFAEYLLIKDQRLLHKVDPRLSLDLASFAEPLTVVLDAFHLVNLGEKDHLLVVGGGFIGSLAMLAAKAIGTNVTGLLNRKARPEIMACLNKTGGERFSWNTIAGKYFATPTKLRKKLSGLSGRVVVFHTAPASYISYYIDLLPFGSTIVHIGLSAKKKEDMLSINASKLIFKRLQLMSAFPVPCLYLPEAVSILREHSELFSLLAVDKLPLSQLPGIFNNSTRPKRKVLITM